MTRSGSRNILRFDARRGLNGCRAVNVHLLPHHRLEVKHGERISALPLLFACEVVDDQRHPATENEHFVSDKRSTV